MEAALLLTEFKENISMSSLRLLQKLRKDYSDGDTSVHIVGSNADGLDYSLKSQILNVF